MHEFWCVKKFTVACWILCGTTLTIPYVYFHIGFGVSRIFLMLKFEPHNIIEKQNQTGKMLDISLLQTISSKMIYKSCPYSYYQRF